MFLKFFFKPENGYVLLQIMEEFIYFALLINAINLQAICKDFFYLWAKEPPLTWKKLFFTQSQFRSRNHMQTPNHTILQTR